LIPKKIKHTKNDPTCQCINCCVKKGILEIIDNQKNIKHSDNSNCKCSSCTKKYFKSKEVDMRKEKT